MAKLGKRELDVTLVEPLATVPDALAHWAPTIDDDGRTLRFRFDATQDRVPAMLGALREQGIAFSDLETRKSSLEDIFVDLVGEKT